MLHGHLPPASPSTCNILHEAVSLSGRDGLASAATCGSKDLQLLLRNPKFKPQTLEAASYLPVSLRLDQGAEAVRTSDLYREWGALAVEGLQLLLHHLGLERNHDMSNYE